MATNITININTQGQGHPAQAVAVAPTYPSYVPFPSPPRTPFPVRNLLVAGFTTLLIAGGLNFFSNPLKLLVRIARLIPISYNQSPSQEYAQQSSLPNSEYLEYYPPEQIRDSVDLPTVAPRESSPPAPVQEVAPTPPVQEVAPPTPAQSAPPTPAPPVLAPKKLGGSGKLKFSGKWALPANKGEQIAGYRISSIFGPRNAPVPGASTFHKGTDVAAPTGTPLYAIAFPGEEISVRCWTDSGGGGNVATFRGAGEEFQYLHLSACTPGKAKLGDVIAKVGSTGIGSGPHLHIERRAFPGTKQKVEIERGFVHWSLTGKPPQ
jgi:murein DD-endopeptidase MepM/ murein hydrolase activator NlpD